MKNKAIPCPDCEGQGYINGGSEFATWSRICDRCKGTGTIMVPKTRADRIRSMTDEELAVYIQSLMNEGDTGFHCQQKKECSDLLECDECPPEEWCTKCMIAWLQQPIEEPKLPNIFEDKQESGLIEED